MRAHLLGGVPKTEVAAKGTLLKKFGVKAELVFQGRDEHYYDFRPEVTGKEAIKVLVETDANVRRTLDDMAAHLADWWSKAQEDFARLAPSAPPSPLEEGIEKEKAVALKEGAAAYLTLQGKELPNVRKTLIESLKNQLVPIGVLDEFQVAGVFVNWWDGIKYDLKTIMTNGWSPTLIPDRYLIEAFFQREAKEIEELEAGVGEKESALAEAVEAAQALLEYEAEEDESITAALMRKELTAAIKDLKTSKAPDAKAGPETPPGSPRHPQGHRGGAQGTEAETGAKPVRPGGEDWPEEVRAGRGNVGCAPPEGTGGEGTRRAGSRPRTGQGEEGQSQAAARGHRHAGAAHRGDRAAERFDWRRHHRAGGQGIDSPQAPRPRGRAAQPLPQCGEAGAHHSLKKHWEKYATRPVNFELETAREKVVADLKSFLGKIRFLA